MESHIQRVNVEIVLKLAVRFQQQPHLLSLKFYEVTVFTIFAGTPAFSYRS